MGILSLAIKSVPNISEMSRNNLNGLGHKTDGLFFKNIQSTVLAPLQATPDYWSPPKKSS